MEVKPSTATGEGEVEVGAETGARAEAEHQAETGTQAGAFTEAQAATGAAGSAARSGSKRGLVLAIAALACVLVFAFFGYRSLAASAKADSSAAQESAAQAGATQAGATQQGATQQSPEQQSSAQANAKTDAPLLKDYDSTVYTLEGEPVSLTEIAANKPLVMNFWATWCPYCIQEMGDFLELYRSYGDRVSFAFIDSTDGQRETVEVASSWLQDNGYAELPSYYDTELQATFTYGINSLPTTIIVSSEGKILDLSPGRIDPAKLSAMLDSLV